LRLGFAIAYSSAAAAVGGRSQLGGRVLRSS
jgi:hypothetical protein